MEDIVERLRYGANCPVSGDGDNDKLEAAEEIESLRAQLAATQQDRDEWKIAAEGQFERTCNVSNELFAQLIAAQAHAARLAEALRSENFAADGWANAFYNAFQHVKNLRDGITSDFGSIIANLNECSEQAQADWMAEETRAALSTPINLDALHEDRAVFIDDVVKHLLNDVCFNMGSGSPYRKMLHDYIGTLREQAAAHRAKMNSYQ